MASQFDICWLLRPQNKRLARYEYDKFRDRPFAEFLRGSGLSGTLSAVALYAIALADGDPCEETMTTEEGMQLVRR